MTGTRYPHSPESSDNIEAYPTEQRERQKAREKELKAQNPMAKRKARKKHVEAHHDDCGQDLRGLGSEALYSELHDDASTYEEDDLHLDTEVVFAASVPTSTCRYFGSDCPAGFPNQPTQTHIVANVAERHHLGMQCTPG